ncbi:hypothetical protein IGI04_032870 [Brassica rapa subsp. trilocularis]|uniref:Secreted protein n=1 Tax=Brassica rapa subsp. trilocularis TaxID=1813537 RepID=A0ABQ7L6Z7_BRACM|nr:hypothetical protein IGI04_032870 [Brassica rapa subsp. trilocularis]
MEHVWWALLQAQALASQHRLCDARRFPCLHPHCHEVCRARAKAAHARTSNSFSDLVQELWNQGRLRKRALNTLVLLPVETTLFAFVSCFADDNVSA